VLLLTIGYAMLALAGADGFELTLDGDAVRAELDETAVRAQAQALIDDVGTGAMLVSASTPDGVSARVTVRGRWDPPLLSLFVPDGLTLESTATSRTALR
jgi:hypothetical protein